MSQSQPQADEFIWVLGLPGPETDEEGGEGDRLPFFKAADAKIGRRRVPVDALSGEVKSFLARLEHVFDDLPDAMAAFDLDSIEVNTEVSATGTVSLLGSGAEATASGGLTFKLTRRRDPA
jgi:hypothetical protein